MALPVVINFRESSEVEWSELTRLLDVTPFGASFATAHHLDVGHLLHMTLPMPRQMRCFDHVADQYKVWALVRYVKAQASAQVRGQEKSVVGVAFVGKNPPESYEITPGKVYQAEAEGEENATVPASTAESKATVSKPNGTPIVSAPVAASAGNVAQPNASAKSFPQASVKTRSKQEELRTGTRHNMPVDIILEVMGASGPVSSMREQTVTENISRRGASVFTTFHIECGTLVRLTSARYQISVNAFVLARRIGQDGIPRLHLKFTDQQWPLED